MDTMNKYCTLVIVGFLVVFSTCSKKEDIGSQDYIEENKDNVSNSIDSVVSEEKLNEVEEFVLEYYKTRNELFAIYKFKTAGRKEYSSFFSEYPSLQTNVKYQNINVVSDSYKIDNIDFYPNTHIDYDENFESIVLDQYRATLSTKILGRISDGIYLQEEKEHISLIFVIDTKEGYRIYADPDSTIFYNGDHYELGDIYIFEDDISEFIK